MGRCLDHARSARSALRPLRGLLLVAGTRSENLGVPPQELMQGVCGNYSEAGARLPSPERVTGGQALRVGARAAAEDDLIEEEDLPLLDVRPGDTDALGRRALAAAPREWARRVEPDLSGRTTEIHDTEGAESLGLGEGALTIVVRIDAGDPRPPALAAHKERILSRTQSGDFGATPELPAAPAASGEADLIAAPTPRPTSRTPAPQGPCGCWRRVLGDAAGGLEIRAAWRTGGIEEQEGRLVHRRGFAWAENGHVLVCGSYAAAGTGNMWASAPPLGVPRRKAGGRGKRLGCWSVW